MCTYLGMFTYLGIVVWIKVLQTGKYLYQTFCHFMSLHYISIPCYTIKYKLFSAAQWSMRIQLHPHTHHIVTPGFVDRPRWSDCTAGQMDGEAGWWTTSKNIGLTLLARVMGVSR